MRIRGWILLLLLTSPTTTLAFGGFFGRSPPNQPITSNNDAIVYGLTGNIVTLQIQLHYEAFQTEDATEDDISEISGIPLGKLDTGEKARLKNLEAELESRIKGQDPAVRAVAKSIRRARSGMRDGKRPVASLLFCGPTGVGKVCIGFD